ncbi:50S ribosomal protein L21, mitochondrial [Argentina anserina]|uniref:50S ribosomal protein L21, mitochondrial n=1 Tax=Argentina anserina TaxID=57926 RepID=UPI0021766054|nr:50S ribosomal protein L21, mitochondrial [Potentilla anserina]
MSNRRCLQLLTRRLSALFSANPPLHTLSTPPPLSTHEPLKSLISQSPLAFSPNWSHRTRHFSSDRNDGVDGDTEEDGDDSDGDEIGYSSDENASLSKGGGSKREYTAEEMAEEAAGIGYKVVGPLETTDGVFKPYEPVFAVVQIGSHQFKVSNGDSIFTERLKFCEVNDKLILNKVLLVGTSSQTMIGRPIVPDATVHAVIEEHALDAKVLIFKKKRRKNYRRCKGHRQELTKLRIIDIQGIQKPEPVVTEKPSKTPGKKSGKVAVAA